MDDFGRQLGCFIHFLYAWVAVTTLAVVVLVALILAGVL